MSGILFIIFASCERLSQKYKELLQQDVNDRPHMHYLSQEAKNKNC